jgi:hypothetical protein
MSAGFPKIQRRRSGDSWAVAKFPAKSVFPAGSHQEYVEDCPVYAGGLLVLEKITHVQNSESPSRKRGDRHDANLQGSRTSSFEHARQRRQQIEWDVDHVAISLQIEQTRPRDLWRRELPAVTDEALTPGIHARLHFQRHDRLVLDQKIDLCACFFIPPIEE